MRGFDPWSVLGIDPTADGPALAAARDAALRRCADDTGERERVEFAFACLSDPRLRAREALLGPRTVGDPREVLADLRRLPRPAAGAQLWLDALRG